MPCMGEDSARALAADLRAAVRLVEARCGAPGRGALSAAWPGAGGFRLG